MMRRSCLGALGLLAVVLGCGHTRHDLPALSAALQPLVSARSAARLPQAATNQEPLVIAISHGDRPAPQLPADQARSLAFVPGLALLEVQPTAAPALRALPNDVAVMVWGRSTDVSRLGPALRAELARILADGQWDDASVSAIATVDGSAADLVARLAELQASVGSQSSTLVTLKASPEALLDLLAYADLRALEAPTTLQPSLRR